MGDRPENTITEVTRRAITDYLSVGRHWSGGLNEDKFLGRIYDEPVLRFLAEPFIPSFVPRPRNART